MSSFCSLIGETKIPKYAKFWVKLMDALEEHNEEEILKLFHEANPDTFSDIIIMIANYYDCRVKDRDFFGGIALKLLNLNRFEIKPALLHIRYPTFTYFLFKNQYFDDYSIPEISSVGLYFNFLADSLINRENPFIPPDYSFVSKATNKTELILQIAQHGYLDGTPELAIKNDDVQIFNNFVTSNVLDIKAKTFITPYDVCGFDRSYRSSKPISYLSFAAFYSSKKIFKQLLLNGLVIDDEVFRHAVRGGDFELIHICEQNLKSIQDISAAALEGVLYCRNDVADWAIQKGALFADINSAVMANNVPAVLFCLNMNKGINSNEAMHEAAIIGNPAIVEAMLERHSPNTEAPNANRSIIHAAALNGHLRALQLIVEKGGDANKLACCSNAGRNALHFAAIEGFNDCIKYLIGVNCNINQKDYSGSTPLHIAANNGQTETARLFIDSGADPNETNQPGMTPLFLTTTFAPKKSKLKMIKMLIEKGANPNAGDPKYRPIDAAKKSNLGQEIIELLK